MKYYYLLFYCYLYIMQCVFVADSDEDEQMLLENEQMVLQKGELGERKGERNHLVNFYSTYRDILPEASRVKCLAQRHFGRLGIEPTTF